MGPGRWGTTTPSLGVPTSFAEIDTVDVICEIVAMRADLIPDVKLRNQTGFEAYWKILLTPNLWITPGFQFLWNPALNPTADRVFIPHFKFRLAY